MLFEIIIQHSQKLRVGPDTLTLFQIFCRQLILFSGFVLIGVFIGTGFFHNYIQSQVSISS